MTAEGARPVAVFDRGIDFSGFRLPSVQSLAHFGARFVVRYSAGAASDPSHPNHADVAWKLCGPQELRRLVAAGYDFVANSEWTASRVTSGSAAGAQDGAADLAFWQARGLAAGASIYVSWDDDQPDPQRHDAVAAYLEAYQQALNGRYRVDLYAGDVAIAAMLDRGLIRFGWRAMADSWSGNGDYYRPGPGWRAAAARVASVSPAHLWQDGNTWYGGGADEDVVLALPIGSHLEAAAGSADSPGPRRGQPSGAPHTPPTNGPEGTRISGIYRVRPGDTLTGIAARFGMTHTQLEELNPRAGHPPGNFDLIRPGDRLTVRGPRRPLPYPGVVYVVQPGDTLTAIADAWGVSLAAVKKANPTAGHPPGNVNLIEPGDVIVHP